MKNSRISTNAMFFEVIYDIGLLLEAIKWNLLLLWFMVLAILFLSKRMLYIGTSIPMVDFLLKAHRKLSGKKKIELLIGI